MKIRAKKSLGQHFLRDKNVISKIEQILREYVEKDTCVLEIGPGDGVLTQVLDRIGFFRIVLVEKDKRCVELLKEKGWHSDIEIIEADFRDDFVVDRLSELNVGYVVANIPYYITGDIIEWMILSDIKTGFLMLQKELFNRAASSVGESLYSAFSVCVQAFFDVKKFLRVSPHSFAPSPSVWSVFAGFFRKDCDTIDWSSEKKKRFLRFVRSSFSQRRKKLMSNDDIKSFLLGSRKGFLLERRPQEIGVCDWIELFLMMDSLERREEGGSSFY